MTANYYTLASLVRELAPELHGACFVEAYSHRPNELRIRFDRGTLVAILRPVDGALFWSTSNEHRPKLNVQLFFSELQGECLQSITIAENDREIRLSFLHFELRLSFFGSPNAVLLREGERVEAFKRSAETELPPTGGSKLGKRYARELTLAGKSEVEFDRTLRDRSSAFLHERGDEILLSLIPLASLGDGWKVREVSSINDAIRETVVERGKRQRVSALRRQLLSDVEHEIDRVRRAQSEMRKGAEDSNRPERYAAIGNTILMHAHELPKGVSEVTLEVEERPMLIKLDPALSPYENAARYFERSKRAFASREDLKMRAKSLVTELAELERRKDAIVRAESFDVLLALKQTNSGKPKQQATPAFREYIVAGGMTVLVGKNAKQNDELTLHVARKDDIWLHARGVPGSHVVLQTHGRKQVPKEAIVQAAEIAAYHSDAKTQKHAPVSYIERKYVRKPKGADPGAVVMAREEVVIVTPRVPAT